MGNETSKTVPVRDYGLLGKKKVESLSKMVKKQYPQLAMGESMLVADNTQPDCPIVMCNKEFLELTKYDREDVLGFNCRFLQGRHTDPDTVAKVRHAVHSGEELEVEILNYRKDGVPFANRFLLLPVRSKSEVKYFLAVQRDITPYTLEAQPADWAPVEVAVYLEKHGIHAGLLPLIQAHVTGAQFMQMSRDEMHAVGVQSAELLDDIMRVQAELRENGPYFPQESQSGTRITPPVASVFAGRSSESENETDDEDTSTSAIGTVEQVLPDSFRAKGPRGRSQRKRSGRGFVSTDTGDGVPDPFTDADEVDGSIGAVPTSEEVRPHSESDNSTDSALMDPRRASFAMSLDTEKQAARPDMLQCVEIFVEEGRHALFAEHYDALAKCPGVQLTRSSFLEETLFEIDSRAETSDDECTCLVCPVSAVLELKNKSTLASAIIAHYGAKAKRLAKQLLDDHWGELPVGACFVRRLEARHYIMFAVVCRTWATPFFSYAMPYATMRGVMLEVQRHNKNALDGTPRRGMNGSVDAAMAFSLEDGGVGRRTELPRSPGRIPAAPITHLYLPALMPDEMRNTKLARTVSAESRLGTAMATSDLRRGTSSDAVQAARTTSTVLSQSVTGEQAAHQTRLALDAVRTWRRHDPTVVDDSELLVSAQSRLTTKQRRDRLVNHLISGALGARGLRTAEELEWLVRMIAADEMFGRDRRLQHVAAIAVGTLLSSQPLFSHLLTDLAKAVTTNADAFAHILRMATGGFLRLCHVLRLDRMENVKQVARGAAGAVFRADMPYRGVRLPVAIKLLHDTADTREYHREVAIMSLFAHPRLVRLYGAGRAEDRFFHVTEWADQGSLFDAYLCPRARSKSMSLAVQLRILLDVAEGMAALHESNVVHRDLKSMNVVLFGDRAKITDYGTSKIMDMKMTAGVGTSAWMAPEVIMGGQYDVSSDVYSFAMTMYEVFARRIPFEDVKFSGQLIEKLRRDERPSLPDGMPAAVRKLCTKCWATNAAKRPTAEEIAKSLSTALDEARSAETLQSPRKSHAKGGK